VVPVVAGPLANVAVGAILFLGLWRWRSPSLVPALIWGPIALIQESTTALVQVGTREAGTDWVLIIAAGMPGALIVALAGVGVLVGFAGLFLLLPVSGLEPEAPLWSRLGTLILGMGGYPVLTIGLTLAFADAGPNVSRNIRITAFVVLIAIFLAMLYPAVSRRHRLEVADVPRSAGWTAMALGAVVFVVFLVV